MDEISVQPVVAGGDVRQQGWLALHLQRVPAHVRDLQPRRRLDRRDVAADPVEAGDRLVFEPARRHQLHADADAEERPSTLAHRVFQRVDHAGDSVEAAATIGEGADAGQHDVIGAGDEVGVAGHLDDAIEPRFARRALERLVGGVQVTRAVIDDGDGHRDPPASGNRPMTGGGAPGGPLRDGGAGGRGGSGAVAARAKKARSAVNRSAAQRMSASGRPRRVNAAASKARPSTPR